MTKVLQTEKEIARPLMEQGLRQEDGNGKTPSVTGTRF